MPWKILCIKIGFWHEKSKHNIKFWRKTHFTRLKQPPFGQRRIYSNLAWKQGVRWQGGFGALAHQYLGNILHFDVIISHHQDIIITKCSALNIISCQSIPCLEGWYFLWWEFPTPQGLSAQPEPRLIETFQVFPPYLTFDFLYFGYLFVSVDIKKHYIVPNTSF